ncbi:hypothetical protein BLA29_014781 [Euroglyphus maynei]|uniref:Uncharacterized protein n=1 Tax=Euroglyphus maynei TaxID=6958 RepID=A0A1Y3AVZ2_EURMA|nr:hypothetical protein BLA29_014781 [Euroglyphus maynei]
MNLAMLLDSGMNIHVRIVMKMYRL